MFQPKTIAQHKRVTKKLQVLAAASFALFLVFGVLVIVLGLQLITVRRDVVTKIDQINTLSTVAQKQNDQIILTKRQLAAQAMLPPLDSFNMQCPGSNTDDGLFTALSDTPIESYNVFLVDCRSSISAGKSTPRIIVFRVNNDGTKELTYGASDSEPLCISNKLPVANKLATRLSLPVCQTN